MVIACLVTDDMPTLTTCLPAQVVGWYHSHPTFAPEPSLIDIENQHQYQQLMRNEGTGSEPFVGLIVGTYDDSVKQPVSLFRYFHVRRIKMSSSARAGAADSGVNFPMAMEVYLGHNEACAKEEAEAEAAAAPAPSQQQEGLGMDLLAAVTSNLPSLPTPTATASVAAKADGEEGAATTTNGNGSAAAPCPTPGEGPAGAVAPALAPAPAPTVPASADRRSQSVFLAVKEKRHRPLPPSNEIWAGIEARFLSPSPPSAAAGDACCLLRCTLETVRLLVEYYSRLATRVDFEEEWRRGTSKGEKFELSLRKRVAALPGLGPDPQRRQAFLEALLEFILAAWVEGTPRRLPQPEDFSGTRRERQKLAAAAREAVLAAEKEAAAKEKEEVQQEDGTPSSPAPPASAAAAAAPAVPAAAAPAPAPAPGPASASASAGPKVPSIPPPPPPLEEEEEENGAEQQAPPPKAQLLQQPPRAPAQQQEQPPSPQPLQSFAV